MFVLHSCFVTRSLTSKGHIYCCCTPDSAGGQPDTSINKVFLYIRFNIDIHHSLQVYKVDNKVAGLLPSCVFGDWLKYIIKKWISYSLFIND
jgi:hypothetical protein